MIKAFIGIELMTVFALEGQGRSPPIIRCIKVILKGCSKANCRAVVFGFPFPRFEVRGDPS